MREVVFHVEPEANGAWRGVADRQPLRIKANSFEDLQHEARDALIRHFGASHSTYRVRLKRPVTRPQLSTGCAAGARPGKGC